MSKTIMCGHPELMMFPKPDPTAMVGCEHCATCITCGFGWAVHPHDFNCPKRLTKATDKRKQRGVRAKTQAKALASPEEKGIR